MKTKDLGLKPKLFNFVDTNQLISIVLPQGALVDILFRTIEKMNTVSRFLVLAVILSLTNCQTKKFYYNKKQSDFKIEEKGLSGIESVLYLVGDAGEPELDGHDPTMSALNGNLLLTEADKTGVIFLGDNIYSNGMHSHKHEKRSDDEARMDVQIEALKNFEGQVTFIPGNHDWNKGKDDGLKYVKRQEKYVEKRLGDKAFIPDKGCPGPVLKELGDNLAIVIIDTQWWLQKNGRPEGDLGGCDIHDDKEFIEAIAEMLDDNKDKQIVVVGHHPFHSNGTHGGYFTWKDHLFPLTAFSKNAYLPLPGIGSIYPLFRKHVGNIQDIAHERYEALINLLDPIFQEHPNMIYACGHEHNLQFIEKEGVNYIVSGAGSKETYVRRNKNIDFGVAREGFVRVIEYKNKEVWVEYIVPNEISKLGEVVYSKQISSIQETSEIIPLLNYDFDYNPNLCPHAAHSGYEAGFMKKQLFGSLYRTTWTDTVYTQILDMDKEGGGLIPIQRGGGMQTKSLRMEGQDGLQYVVRSINKFPEKVIPKELRSTVVSDILSDGIAGSNPYGFVTIPPLADAVGVYHTNPKIVIMPDHPRLGVYREEFKGMLCLFEERPAGNQSDNPSFGNAKKVVSSAAMIEHLQEDNNANVDEFVMLRARFLDMLIADWDRHDDQWRWARFRDKGKTVYKPIPRDRDQAYFRQDGLIPYFTGRQWAVRKFQSFKPEIRDVIGQNYNARWVDRAYLTDLDLEEWLAVADSMQSELTDPIIQDAIKRLPTSAYKLEGEYITETLKTRRDNLNETALRYYKVLAKKVDVVGTYRSEYFKIKYKNKSIIISSYKRKKGDKIKDELLYHRKFTPEFTKEIRIFGIGGEDEYEISGDASKCKILLRIIGGDEDDKYKLKGAPSDVRGKIFIYDFNETEIEKELKKISKLHIKVNEEEHNHPHYDREEFKYNSYLPVIYPAFNADDGFFVGGGVSYKKHEFKKFPYANSHTIRANVAVSGAFNFDYKCDFRDAIGNFDIAGELVANVPNFGSNFYGLGNDAVKFEENIEEFQMRTDKYSAALFIKKASKYNRLRFLIGPRVEHYNPSVNELQEARFPEFLNVVTLEEQTYFGGVARLEYEKKDNITNPIRGVYFKTEISQSTSLSDEGRKADYSFAEIHSELTLYFPLKIFPFKHTIAIRTNIDHITSETPYYLAKYIGGIEEMRGFRRNRIGGETAFYNNIDFRFKLYQFNNYILPMELGLIGFTDIGRVWYNHEDSDLWHMNYGGGVYIIPAGVFVFTISYALSDADGGLVLAKAGFQF